MPMCGRFVSRRSLEEIVELFGIEQVFCEALAPNFNVAPTQQVYVLLEENQRRLLTSMRWGLIPAWAQDASVGPKAINARAETASQKPSFREAFRYRRCLVLADGYYEWRREGKRRTPMYIHALDDAPLAFAGLWERWTPPEQRPHGPPVESCTILTTEANQMLSSLHHRMPVILPRSRQASWLDHTHFSLPKLMGLLTPLEDEALAFHQVSDTVNYVGHNDPQNIVPVEPSPPPKQGKLFDF